MSRSLLIAVSLLFGQVVSTAAPFVAEPTQVFVVNTQDASVSIVNLKSMRRNAFGWPAAVWHCGHARLPHGCRGRTSDHFG